MSSILLEKTTLKVKGQSRPITIFLVDGIKSGTKELSIIIDLAKLNPHPSLEDLNKYYSPYITEKYAFYKKKYPNLSHHSLKK